MKYRWKLTVALGFVGAAAMGAVAFGQNDAPATDPLQVGPRAGQRLQAGQDQEGPRHRRGLHRRVVHSVAKVQLPDGSFGTLTVDQGTITAVDAAAKTVTIKRADGESVTITATDETHVRRDRSRATLSDLKVGDRCRVVQMDQGEGSVVKLIGARSAGAEGDADAEPAGLDI